MKPRIFVSTIALVGAVGLASLTVPPARTRAATNASAPSASTQSGGMPMQHQNGKQGQNSMMDMQKMMSGIMDMHRKMMSSAKEANAQLDQLVSKMDAAQGDAKIAAMAELLKTLVKQREQMQMQHMQMDGQMMNGMNMMNMMMGHMKGGMGGNR